MAVFRVEKTKGYTVMSNHHLRNPDLTLKAKGLLSQMLSLPENWDYTLKGLSSINKECIDAIRTAVWELEKAGYIIRRQGRDEQGKMTAIEYTIFELPQPPELENPTTANPVLGNPISDKPTAGNPVSENPMQINKELSNKELLNPEVSSTDSIPIVSTPFSRDVAKPPERNGNYTSMEKIKAYDEIIKSNIEYDYLIKNPDMDKNILDEIVSLMLEIVCTQRNMIRIAGDDFPAELVRKKFLSLDSSHMQFVLNCITRNTTQIRNIKKYLLAVLFNASSTIESYYTTLVNHDLNGGTL